MVASKGRRFDVRGGSVPPPAIALSPFALADSALAADL